VALVPGVDPRCGGRSGSRLRTSADPGGGGGYFIGPDIFSPIFSRDAKARIRHLKDHQVFPRDESNISWQGCFRPSPLI
jgi:hypothetical protein